MRYDDWITKAYIKEFINPKQDFYKEGNKMIMTENYHIKRGYCCGSGCRHCPYIPKHNKGSNETKKN
tara:strand:+ start:317 stop:517 length:201 start_codon:yes stop_codon:yes gene_type:complete